MNKETMREEWERLKQKIFVYGEEEDLLRRALENERIMRETLTVAQQRCTELLEENRLIRAQYDAVVGRAPYAGSKHNIANAITTAVLNVLKDVL